MCSRHLLNNDRSLNRGFKLELFSFSLIYNLDTHKDVCLLGSRQRLKAAFLKNTEEGGGGTDGKQVFTEKSGAKRL